VTSPRSRSIARMDRFAPFALVTCLLILFSTNALAFRIPMRDKKGKDLRLSVDITLTSAFEWHQNNFSFQRPAHTLDYQDLQNRLNIDVVFGDYRVGGRLDTFTFFNDDQAPCKTGSTFDCKGQYIPEKMYLKFRAGPVDFVAGDFYLTVGRGIALAIRKVDEFGLDTTLRGGRASIEQGDFRATIAGGFTNTNNLDPVQEVFFNDPNHFIFTTSLSQRLFNLMTLGAHYVYADQSEKLGDSFFEAKSHIAGGSLDFKRLFNFLDVYFEGNVAQQLEGTIPNTGYALYTSFNAFLFPFTLQVEGQWYHKFAMIVSPTTQHDTVIVPPFSYLNPPTMERQDLDTQGENSNSKGFRVRLDYTLPSRQTVFFLNYMYRFGFTEVQEPDKQLHIHHVYAGGEHRFGHTAQITFSGGLREITGFETWRLAHGDIDASFHISPKHSIEFVTRYWWNRKQEDLGTEIQERIYHIYDAQLSYSISKLLSAAFLFSYTNEFTNEGARQLYVAGEIKFFILQYGYIKVFYGQSRSGLRCVSGVCRIFPAFEGFRTELTFRL